MVTSEKKRQGIIITRQKNVPFGHIGACSFDFVPDTDDMDYSLELKDMGIPDLMDSLSLIIEMKSAIETKIRQRLKEVTAEKGDEK